MASLGTLHADAIALSQRLGGTYRKAGDFSLLTNTTVASADTVAGLASAVSTAVVHADAAPAKDRVDRAIDYGDYSGELTNARILSLTTVEGLVGLTYVTNTSLRDLVVQ